MYSYVSLDLFITEVVGGHVLLVLGGGSDLLCWANFGSQRLVFVRRLVISFRIAAWALASILKQTKLDFVEEK